VDADTTATPAPDWTDTVACITAARADVDAVPRVEIRSAWRDLSCRGSGPEEFRRVAYAPAGVAATVWPDADRLPAVGIRASERRVCVSCEVPVGTLVQRFERDVFRGARGKCRVRFAIVVAAEAGVADDGPGRLAPVPHRTLRARPVYEITLPTGELCYVARRP